ncbi:hypothetical protein [Cryobacterium sp. BB307]|uniref:hypothetical protein n=1 Tax=Cryobacterium sp. BB307 TaxID=2716317 RepID=UPI001445F5C4|nr:hypothetical protein [Cryobacterium sp. BB307]
MLPVRRHHLTSFLAVALTLTGSLILSGCASDAATPPTGQDSTGDAAASEAETNASGSGSTNAGGATATAAVDAKTFTFAPTLCAIDADDVLVRGPGKDDSTGEPVFLDIDLTNLSDAAFGGVRIELGTDQPFDTSDEFFVAHITEDEDFSLDARAGNPSSMDFSADFRHATGTSAGHGAVEVRCG